MLIAPWQRPDLSNGDMAKVRVLREQVLALSARGDENGALAAEAQAMTIMGLELEDAGWVRPLGPQDKLICHDG